MVTCSRLRKGQCMAHTQQCVWLPGKCRSKNSNTKYLDAGPSILKSSDAQRSLEQFTNSNQTNVTKKTNNNQRTELPRLDDLIISRIAHHLKDKKNIAQLQRASKTFQRVINLIKPSDGIVELIWSMINDIKDGKRPIVPHVEIGTNCLYLSADFSDRYVILTPFYRSSYDRSMPNSRHILTPIVSKQPFAVLQYQTVATIEEFKLFLKDKWEKPLRYKRDKKFFHKKKPEFHTIPATVSAASFEEYLLLMMKVKSILVVPAIYMACSHMIDAGFSLTKYFSDETMKLLIKHISLRADPRLNNNHKDKLILTREALEGFKYWTKIPNTNVSQYSNNWVPPRLFDD